MQTKFSLISLYSKGLIIRLVEPKDARILYEYRKRNFRFHYNWTPSEALNLSPIYWQQYANKVHMEHLSNQTNFCYIVFKKTDLSKIIAMISVSNICLGSFNSCTIGYDLDEKYQGKGIMKCILAKVIKLMTLEYGIKRISACYQEDNNRSEKLLKSLKFVKEGVMIKSILIAGKRCNQVLASYLVD